MKVKSLSVRVLKVTYEEQFGGREHIPSHILWPRAGQVLPRDGAYATLVEVVTSDGIVGIGEALSIHGPEVVGAIIRELLAPLVVGSDIRDVATIWHRMYESHRGAGHSRGFLMEAMSGVDIAIWDALGKHYGTPVYRLIGGAFRKKIPVYASPVPLTDDQDLMVSMAKDFVAQGFTAIKVKIGRGIDRDVEDMRLIRQALGPDVKLLVDCNCVYDLFSARHLGRMLEPLNIYWFEEPIPPEDPEGYVALRNTVNIPVVAGENEATVYNFREFIARRAVWAIQPNISRVGGITEAIRVGTLADAFNMAVAPHGVGGAVFLAATLQWSAATKNFLMTEYNRRPNQLRDDLAEGGFTFETGCLKVPEGPGLGITLKSDLLEKWTTAVY